MIQQMSYSECGLRSRPEERQQNGQQRTIAGASIGVEQRRRIAIGASSGHLQIAKSVGIHLTAWRQRKDRSSHEALRSPSARGTAGRLSRAQAEGTVH